MIKSITLSVVVTATFLSVMSTSHGQGRNQIFKNPNPDLTWSKQVGSIFSAAKSYAVVISISDYIGKDQGGYMKLNTHGDAERMTTFLLQDMGFDYVHVITDKEVTKRNIETIMIDEMRTLIGPNDRFVFYWSGHGTQLVRADNNVPFGFLPLYDSKVLQFSSMISMDDIARWNSYLQARHALFILDACLSGLAGVNAKSNPQLDQMSLPARFLITAGRATEDTIVSDRWGGSLFTDTLIKITKEYAGSSDSGVSIYRLFDEIQKRVVVEKQRSGWQKPLTPQLRDLLGGGGQFFFVTRPGTSPVPSDVPAEATLRPVVVPKGPAEERDEQDHCDRFSSAPSNLFGVRVLGSPPHFFSIPEALRIHLGANTPLRSSYTKDAGSSSIKSTFDLPGILRGSYETVSSTVPKCDGTVPLRRATIMENGSVIAITYSNDALAGEGSEALHCRHQPTHPHGNYFNMEGAFIGIVEDAGLKDQVSIKRSKFKETRIVNISNDILGYTIVIKSEGQKIRRCTETILYAASGRQ